MEEFFKEGLKHVGLTMSQQCDLISMNDSGDDFNIIASWIEKNIKAEGQGG